MTRRARQTGFTLIEIMIAIMLMAIMSLLCWRAIDSVTRARDRVRQNTEEINSVLHAVDQMNRDVDWRATTELPSGPSAFDSNGAPVATTQLLPTSIFVDQAGGTRLQMIRSAASKAGTWQRVQWWVAGTTLYRAAGAVSDRLPLPAPIPADGATVLNGVIGFEVRAWVPGSGWIRLPASASGTRPSPQAAAPGADPGQPQVQAQALEIVITRGSAVDPQRYRTLLPLR